MAMREDNSKAAVVLHLDASARGERSHTRRLGRRFVDRWLTFRPQDQLIYRDIGRDTPPPVSEQWIAAAFTKPERRSRELKAALAGSDELVDELERANIIVAGVPMYNFGVPASMKAYVDNVVRVGRTFGFDPSRQGGPYWPMLSGKRMVVLSSRGDHGYDPGGRLAHMNHVEPYLRMVFGWLGVTDFTSIAVEFDEFGGQSMEQSLALTEAKVDHLVDSWTGSFATAA